MHGSSRNSRFLLRLLNFISLLFSAHKVLSTIFCLILCHYLVLKASSTAELCRARLGPVSTDVGGLLQESTSTLRVCHL